MPDEALLLGKGGAGSPGWQGEGALRYAPALGPSYEGPNPGSRHRGDTTRRSALAMTEEAGHDTSIPVTAPSPDRSVLYLVLGLALATALRRGA